MAEKKSKSNVTKLHPNRSFEDYVSDANLNKLKPFIQTEVTNVGRQILMQVSNLVLQQVSEMKVRSFAVENILKAKLGITDNDVAEAISDEEDKLMGYLKTSEGAMEGDLVRLEMTTIENDNPAAGKMAIRSLGTKGPEGKVQTLDELEADIVGKKAGDVGSVTKDKGTYNYMINRVSRKVENANPSNQ